MSRKFALATVTLQTYATGRLKNTSCPFKIAPTQWNYADGEAYSSKLDYIDSRSKLNVATSHARSTQNIRVKKSRKGKENGRKSRWWHTGMWQLRGSFTSARAVEFLLLQRPRLLSTLFLSHGVAVQVTSITALNARLVPTSTSFCSPARYI